MTTSNPRSDSRRLAWIGSRFSTAAGARVLGLAVTLGLAIGCDSNQSSRPVDPPIERVAPAASAGAATSPASRGDQKILRQGPFEKAFDGISFSIPAGWKEVELSPAQQGFIDARFQVPTPHGEVTLTCSSNAGGIETNLRRWMGQFHLSRRQAARDGRTQRRGQEGDVGRSARRI
jgi:hypothetical protein